MASNVFAFVDNPAKDCDETVERMCKCRRFQPFFRMAETATASVDAIIAPKRAACSQVQPMALRLNTYSSTGTNMAVLAITIRKAKQMTWKIICAAMGGQMQRQHKPQKHRKHDVQLSTAKHGIGGPRQVGVLIFVNSLLLFVQHYMPTATAL